MDAQADLHLCCSHTTKIGFLMAWPVFRYIGRTSAVLEGKEFVASNFTVKKKNNCWFTMVGVIFAEDSFKTNLL